MPFEKKKFLRINRTQMSLGYVVQDGKGGVIQKYYRVKERLADGTFIVFNPDYKRRRN